MSLFRRRLGVLIALVLVIALGIFLLFTIGPSSGSLNGSATPSPTPVPSVGASPTIQPAPPGSPTGPVPTAVPAIPTVAAGATIGMVVGGNATPPSGTTIYLPAVGNGGDLSALDAQVADTATPVPTDEATPQPTATPGPPGPTVTPTPTRGPIRITKLGLGVYESGGAMFPILDESRPSVILLMDPTVDFAQEVRKRFPKAFIIGRIFATSQPLDNPAQRGSDFADRVASTAVPLKGVVDAWMSYNEVAGGSDPQTMTNYNTFQVAFAHRLQDNYGIAAVAGNDGPRAIPAEDYPKYFAEAISTSKYFGFHLYPDPAFHSLQDPAAASQVFYYRQIKAALDAAGIKSGPFIATEVGLYNGWQGVTTDTQMGEDFTWLADQMNNDPFVLGMTIFGVFSSDRQEWQHFNVLNSNILQTMGDYNTVH